MSEVMFCRATTFRQFKQQRSALQFSQLMSDQPDMGIASGLCFKPADFTPVGLASHSPASDFISASSHHSLP